MELKGHIGATGSLKMKVIRAKRAPLAWRLRNTLRLSFIRGWLAYHIAPVLGKLFGFSVTISKLELRVHKADGSWLNYGIVDYRVITTAFVNAMTTALITPASPGNFWFHALGTTSTAPAIGDTALAAEITTQYNPDNTRATGTHVVGGSNNIYSTVGTNTVDGAVACVEMGVLTQAATGGGTLMDRFTFTVVNLASGDGMQTTVQVTQAAGG